MATRRFRIKAVTNLSAARGRCIERPQNSDNVNGNSASKPTDAVEFPADSQGETAENRSGATCLEASADGSSVNALVTNTAVSAVSRDCPDVIDSACVRELDNSSFDTAISANTSERLVARTSVDGDVPGSDDRSSRDLSVDANAGENGFTSSNKSFTDAEGGTDYTKASEPSLLLGQSSDSTMASASSVPVRLPRKRMRPSVCLSSVNRKARDSPTAETGEQGGTDKIEECSRPTGQLEAHQKHLSKSANLQTHLETGVLQTIAPAVKHSGIESPLQQEDCKKNFEPSSALKTRVETCVFGMTVCGIKSGSEGVPDETTDVITGGNSGASMVNVTGTVHQGSIVSSSSINKPEENSSSNCSVNESVKSCGQVNSFRSRFIRPRPRILDSTPRCSKNDSAGSASESDGEKKSLSVASTISPPWRPQLAASRTRLNRTIATEIGKQSNIRRNGASENESEDERHAVSEAETVSPPKKTAKLDSDGGSDTSHTEFSEDTVEEIMSPVKKAYKKPEQTTKRKEYLRRIIEIKREISHKIIDGKINKSRLTMFDLIYYNPVTNPMKSVCETGVQNCGTASSNSTESETRLAEESVDEPEPQTVEDEEGSSTLPVPQVKVGPNGEIILDEQSLVIETTDAKKNWSDLQNSEVIMDYGNGTTTFNAYSKKKRKRTKDWSKEETLRFYRALHTVGTDFLVMQSLFPKFTRKELKDRFKKEERINRALVEKALRNPLTFDLTELQKEFERERLEEENRPQSKLKDLQNRNYRNYSLYATLNSTDKGKVRSARKKFRKHKSRVATPEKNCDERTEENCLEEEEKEKNTTSSPECVPDSVSKCVPNGYSSTENGTKEMKGLAKPVKPTRSGRIPRRRIFEDFMTDELEEIYEETEVTEIHDSVSVTDICDHVSVENISQSEDEGSVAHKTLVVEETAVSLHESQSDDEESVAHENFVVAEDALTVHQSQVNLGNVYSNVKPGTLIVLATESPDNPGHQVLRVFMVSNNSETVPVAVSNNQSSVVNVINSEEMDNLTQPVVGGSSTNDSNDVEVNPESSS